MAHAFYTIGHSTHSITDFVHLLRQAEVRLVADVRTIPRSRTNPQFNKDALPGHLDEYRIGYEHIAELGGLRGRPRGSGASPNTFWQNQSFRNYADFALSHSFAAGLARLREVGREGPAAIMCAEAVWWRCHRRIIADYLLAGDAAVFHILGPGKIEPATMTPAATWVPEVGLVYRPSRASSDQGDIR